MPRTDNQKAVTAYLPLNLYDQLADFKNFKGLRSDSQAIAVILEQFFDSSFENTQTDSNNDVDKQLKTLEQKITFMQVWWKEERDHMLEIMDDLLNRTKFLIPQTIDSNVPGTLESTADSDVPGTLESTVDSDVSGTLESTVDSDVPGTLESTHPYFDCWIICSLKVSEYHADKITVYWTGKNFSPDIREAKPYDYRKSPTAQVQRLRRNSDIPNDVNATTARICLSKILHKYSLQEVFDSWKRRKDWEAQIKIAKKEQRSQLTIATQ